MFTEMKLIKDLIIKIAIINLYKYIIYVKTFIDCDY